MPRRVEIEHSRQLPELRKSARRTAGRGARRACWTQLLDAVAGRHLLDDHLLDVRGIL